MRKLRSKYSFGICIKDTQARILHQNAVCRDICGDRYGTFCRDGCMKSFDIHSDWPLLNMGGKLQVNLELINGSHYDTIIFNDGEDIVSLLFRVKGRNTEHLRFSKKYGLSEREAEVITLAIEGHSNFAISKKLFISTTTLKTHLNNIYKKLPDLLATEIRRRRSKKRHY